MSVARARMHKYRARVSGPWKDAVTRLIIVLQTCAFLFGFGGFSVFPQEIPKPERTAAASRLVDSLANQRFADAAKHFDPTMQSALPPQKLAQVWQSVIAQVGVFRRQTAVRTEQLPPYEIVFVTCEFEKASLDTKVVFNNAGQIAGEQAGPWRTLFSSR